MWHAEWEQGYGDMRWPRTEWAAVVCFVELLLSDAMGMHDIHERTIPCEAYCSGHIGRNEERPQARGCLYHVRLRAWGHA